VIPTWDGEKGGRGDRLGLRKVCLRREGKGGFPNNRKDPRKINRAREWKEKTRREWRKGGNISLWRGGKGETPLNKNEEERFLPIFKKKRALVCRYKVKTVPDASLSRHISAAEEIGKKPGGA